MTQVWELDLPQREKILLLALADFARDDGASVFPSVATMSRKASMSERTVQRTLASLKERGNLRILRPAYGPRTVEYQVVVNGELAHDPDYGRCPIALRQACLDAFEQTCAYCHRRGTEESGPDSRRWHIDRIVPGSRGGAYEAYNVALACASCNSSKGAQAGRDPAPSLGAILDGGFQLAFTDLAEDEENGVPSTTEWGAIHDGMGCHPDTQSISEPSVEPHLAPASRTRERRPREPDPLFEAVCQATGIDWHHLTEASRGPINRAVADVRRVGATPEEVLRRADRWPYDKPLTPPALAKHWPALIPSSEMPRASPTPEDIAARERIKAEVLGR